jgi:hypothetical protein
MSESVILCEGFHDRAFWDGWLLFLGCDSAGFKPGTPGFPALDPWGDPVRRGQYAYRSKSGSFVRLRPCNGKSNVLQEARVRLIHKAASAPSHQRGHRHKRDRHHFWTYRPAATRRPP